jgi:hypothetical protein
MQQQAASTGRYAGRGLEILRRMTRNLKVHGRGNRVEIVYDWWFPDAAIISGA